MKRAGLLVLAAALAAGSSAMAQTMAFKSAGPAAEQWSGQMAVAGAAQEDGSRRMQNASTNVNVKLWLGADGVPRFQLDDCVHGLVPEESSANFADGGLFRVDAAKGGSTPECGLNPGERIVDETVQLSPNREGVRIVYHVELTMQQPFIGRMNAAGQTFLRPGSQQMQVAAAAPAPALSPVVAPAAPSLTGLNQQIDAVIAIDARGWMFNRYDAGSVTGARILEGTADGKSGVIYGDYTYNGGTRGWIKVRVADGVVSCVEYHDFAGRCRAIGRSPAYGILAAGMIAVMTSPSSGSSYASSSGTRDDYPDDPSQNRSSSPPPAYAPSPPPINSFYGDCHNPTGC